MPTSASSGPTAPARVKGCCVQLAPPLPVEQADELATVLRALGDPTRVQMLHMLKAAAEPVCVCDFTAAIDLEQPTISHHLARLREAGVVATFRRGIWAFYVLREDMSDVTAAAVALIP
jgi:ArsR family transcriptional regulator